MKTLSEMIADLKSSYPPSSYAEDWKYIGHNIEYDGGDYGYPGVGFERFIRCSCGIDFRSSRWPAPESAERDVWEQYRQHVLNTLKNLAK